MTWLKLSDDFGDDCARAELSDAAFRTHVEGMLWTMRRESGGHLSSLDLRRLAESPDAQAAVQELLNAGFWEPAEDGWQIIHGMEHQPEPDVLARRRALTAERVRRHRRKKAGLPPDEDTSNAVTERVTDPVTERVTRDGTGRDGTGNPQTAATTEGEALRTGQSANEADTGWVTSRPPVAPGGWSGSDPWRLTPGEM